MFDHVWNKIVEDRVVLTLSFLDLVLDNFYLTAEPVNSQHSLL